MLARLPDDLRFGTGVLTFPGSPATMTAQGPSPAACIGNDAFEQANFAFANDERRRCGFVLKDRIGGASVPRDTHVTVAS